MSSKYTTGLEEYELLDNRTVEYLRQILGIVINTQERIDKLIVQILDPRNCYKIVLLLQTETQVDVKVAEAARRLQLFAGKYLRVVTSKKAVKEGKIYPAALNKYRAAVIELLLKAGLTNEQNLLKSFVARLEKAMYRADKVKAEAQEYL
ncbi:MAG: hypothetical protein ACTSRR_09625 [Candidatus Heimdallarchaeaceae archaeon]